MTVMLTPHGILIERINSASDNPSVRKACEAVVMNSLYIPRIEGLYGTVIITYNNEDDTLKYIASSDAFECRLNIDGTSMNLEGMKYTESIIQKITELFYQVESANEFIDSFREWLDEVKMRNKTGVIF